MELPQLKQIKTHLDNLLVTAFPGYKVTTKIAFPDSPNPVCIFEIEGRCCALGRFWANNEFEIIAMDLEKAIELVNSSGSVYTVNEAIDIINAFCAKLESNSKPST